jgi:NAD(P)-dependent dehydrogenase (short-subunit alcohol dehydrogenase family)
MDLNLRGKRVLITGGSKGLGLACAKSFLAEGAKVAITSRSAENLASAQQVLGNVLAIEADMVDAEAAARMVAEVEAKLGPIDVLVNSAGAARRSPPDELTPAKWREAMDAKFFTYINVIDPVVKLMAKRKSGVIINLTGQGGKVGTPTHLAGGAANAALMLVSAGLAVAYAKEGVRVVGITPGLIQTERIKAGMAAEAKVMNTTVDEAMRHAVSRIPLGRFGDPDEIAAMTVFLASDRAAFATGSNITMDGASTPTVM